MGMMLVRQRQEFTYELENQQRYVSYSDDNGNVAFVVTKALIIVVDGRFHYAALIGDADMVEWNDAIHAKVFSDVAAKIAAI